MKRVELSFITSGYTKGAAPMAQAAITFLHTCVLYGRFSEKQGPLYSGIRVPALDSQWNTSM